MILTHPNPKLREKAAPCPQELFGSQALAEHIAAMREALKTEKNGIGLAATQIGLGLRIILVHLPGEGVVPLLNPEIIQQSKTTSLSEEGCLSVPGVFGLVSRATWVSVRAFTEQGAERIQKWKGLSAVLFQHEIDHLNGILFIDRMERQTEGGSVRV
jgi:peptide deformylase